MRGTLNHEEFLRTITREVCRSRRSGKDLALIIFDMHTRLCASVAKKKFVLCISQRIRLYDEAGWLGKDCVGVLLPQTTQDQAHSLVEHVCCTLVPSGMHCSYRVLDLLQICSFINQPPAEPEHCTCPSHCTHTCCAHV